MQPCKRSRVWSQSASEQKAISKLLATKPGPMHRRTRSLDSGVNDHSHKRRHIESEVEIAMSSFSSSSMCRSNLTRDVVQVQPPCEVRRLGPNVNRHDHQQREPEFANLSCSSGLTLLINNASLRLACKPRGTRVVANVAPTPAPPPKRVKHTPIASLKTEAAIGRLMSRKHRRGVPCSLALHGLPSQCVVIYIYIYTHT